MKYKKIREQIYKRNNKIFKKIYRKQTLNKSIFSFKVNPYSKLKTSLNIELASLIIFFLCKTNITPNFVSKFGLIFILVGVLFFSILSDSFFYLGVLIIFLKLVPDYIDGQLAVIKNCASKTGAEIDAWAGYIGRIIIISGFSIYALKNNPIENENFFYLIVILINFFLYADPRLYLSKYKKFSYDKILKSHYQKMEDNLTEQNILKDTIKRFLKIFYYDGSSQKTDCLILIMILEKEVFNFQFFYILPIIWTVLFGLVFLKALTRA